MTDADLSALILEAPLIPNGWIAALDACNSAFDADLSILTFRSPSQTDSGVTAASTGSNEAIREWGPTLSLIDKEFASGLSSEPLKAMFRTNLMSMSENSESVRTWAQRHEFKQSMTGLLWHGDPHWGVLSCFRRNNIPFSEDDENRLRNLLPRFIRAIDLQRHLEKLTHERDTAYRALDSFSLGVILTLEEGTIVHANEPAKEFLAEGDAIRAVDNRLALQDGADSQLVEYLKKQISRAAKLSTSHSSSNIATFQVPRHEGNFIWLSLAPLNNTPETFGGFLDLEVRQPTATVFILDPSRTPGLSPETLTIRFGLTSAESNLAVALANGASLQEAAALAGRSEATFRKHLQSIFTKTGTHRQSELVSLLLRRVA